MAGHKEIPWNKKPKNGISSFFTEASFYKWLPRDTHESRLAANLEKMCKGIILPKELFEKKEPVLQQSTSAPSGLVDKVENGDNVSDENTMDYQLDGTEVRDDGEAGPLPTGTETENKNTEKPRPENANTAVSTDSKSSPNKEQGVNEELEKKKQAMETNKQFYNDQDRKDKYLPILAKKRPRCSKPSLTSQEQKTYLEMKRRFSKLDSSQLNPQQEADYKMFKALTHKVEMEQQKFMKQLRYSFTQCSEDYQYIHKEADKYINNKIIVKKKRVTELPRFYYPAKRIQLIDYGTDQIEQPVMLNYVRPLLQLGTVPWMVLPQIVSGLPQPCVPTNCQKVEKVYPNVRNVVKGQCVWNHEVCSQDVNAEQLAVSHRCNFVMSSSVVKHLVDNQGFTSKLWNIPVVVRDYDVQDGDKTVTHKVIYLDKPLVKSIQLSVRDKHKLYQKYALRSVAIRENHKPHVFCSTKPSSEVVKYISLEEVYKEMEEFDKEIKKDKPTNQIAFEDSPNESHDEDKEQKKKVRKRRKRVSLDIADTGPVKKGVGLFDIENEIDDLETFGMDTSWKTLAKSGNKSPAKSVGQKAGIDPGLESLKKELEGIKLKAGNNQRKSSLDEKVDNPSAAPSIDLNNEKETNKEHSLTSNKSLPSLSEKLKQMSNIRSKLNLKSLQCEVEAPSTRKTADASSETLDTRSKSKASNEYKEDKNKVKTLDADIASDSESDQSDDGLVIDMPSSADETALLDTSPAKKSTLSQEGKTLKNISPKPNSSKCLEMCAESAENDLSVAPLETFNNSSKDKDDKCIAMEVDSKDQNYKTGMIDKNMSSEDQNGAVCKEGKDSLCINDSDKKDENMDTNENEEKDEISNNSEEENTKKSGNPNDPLANVGVSTRSCKRKSVDKIEASVPPKRKGLRSSVPSNTGSPHRHFTRNSSKRGAAQSNEVEKQNFKESVDSDVTQNQTSKRASRSRGSSLDTSTETSSPVRRVTRQSADKADVDSDCDKDPSYQQPQPKRKGRPVSKKVTQTNKEEEEHESKKIKEMAEAMRKKVSEKGESHPPDAEDNTNAETSQQEVTTIKFYGTGSPNKNVSDEAKGENVNESKQGEETKDNNKFGLDNILDLQTNLLKSPESKETIRGSFAARHGMKKVVFPMKDNVTYHQWKFGSSNILIRCSYHGVANPQGLIHISTKMEYQPYFGFEKQFANDIARNWISTYIRPNCTLVRARVNPYNSEIMMMEYVDPKDLIPHDCLFRPNKAMTDLQSILEGLKDLPAGQYLLNNQRQKDHVCVFKATPDGERGQFDLHYHYATTRVYPKGKEPRMHKWVPIDTDLLLPHQKRMNLIPCTFNPNDAQASHKPPERKRGGKKKKKRKPKHD